MASSNSILREPPHSRKGFAMLALTDQRRTAATAVEDAEATAATEARCQRGLAIAAVCRITKSHNQYIVPSQTGNGTYRVTLNPKPFVPMCTCADYEAREQKCKHVYAVEFSLRRETSTDGTETTTETVTITKKTCTQADLQTGLARVQQGAAG